MRYSDAIHATLAFPIQTVRTIACSHRPCVPGPTVSRDRPRTTEGTGTGLRSRLQSSILRLHRSSPIRREGRTSSSGSTGATSVTPDRDGLATFQRGMGTGPRPRNGDRPQACSVTPDRGMGTGPRPVRELGTGPRLGPRPPRCRAETATGCRVGARRSQDGVLPLTSSGRVVAYAPCVIVRSPDRQLIERPIP